VRAVELTERRCFHYGSAVFKGRDASRVKGRDVSRVTVLTRVKGRACQPC